MISVMSLIKFGKLQKLAVRKHDLICDIQPPPFRKYNTITMHYN
jgi:hypothetical protein